MALRFEIVLKDDPQKDPIDLVASLTKLESLLEQIDTAKQTTVTLHFDPVFSTRQVSSDLPTELLAVIDSKEWIVRADSDLADQDADTQEIMDRS